jgi:hypothetical protein
MPIPKVKEEDIVWKKEELERDESFIDLKVGESIAGTLAAKNNGLFGLYYVIERLDGEIIKLNGSSNLNKWMELHEPGDLIRITRKEDLKIPDPEKNDMKRFEVEKGEIK